MGATDVILVAKYLTGRRSSCLTQMDTDAIEKLREGDLVLEVKEDACYNRRGWGIFFVEEIQEEYSSTSTRKKIKIIFSEIPCNAKKPDGNRRYMWVSDVSECLLECRHKNKCPFRRLFISELP